MKQLTTLLAFLMFAAGLWANEILYTATDWLEILDDNAFDLPVQAHAFNSNTGHGNMSFPGDVTTIKEGAFKNRRTLTAITLPNTITTIEASAFEGCSSLTSINLPNTITTIGEGAFKGCSSLTSITLPSSITTIADATFEDCSKLASFTIPSSVTTIGRMAFRGCYFLKSITIPSSVTEIGMEAFSSCQLLKSVTFEGTACQNAIANDVFRSIGSNEDPATLVLPDDWNYDAAPANNTTAWHGGYFNSNIYSTDGSTEKQAAIDALSILLRDYSESVYLQSLLAEEVAKINAATNRRALNEIKQAAHDKIEFAIDAYAMGITDGYAAGDAAGYQRAKNELPTDPAGTPGHAVTITKGEKSITLYNPTSVSFEKITEE